MKKLILILTIFSMAPPSTFAQSTPNFISAEEVRRQEINTAREMEAKYYCELIGKIFWYKPGKKGRSFHEFYLKASAPNKYISYGDKILPQSLMKFEIIDCLQIGTDYRDGPEYTYKIRFQDGTEAFMKGSSFGSYFPGATHRFESSLNYTIATKVVDAKNDNDANIFLEDPALIIARYNQEQKNIADKLESERVKREKEEADEIAAEVRANASRRKVAAMNAKKGGVSIGMSKQQVLASNWGKPDRVNRTIWSGGTREQWVYGRASYLYFTNDILTTIQN